MRKRLSTFFAVNKTFYFFLLAASIFFSLFFSVADFYSNPINGLKDFIIISSQWGIIWFSTLGLLYIISIHRLTFLIIFPALALTCSILAYFRFAANITLTSMMVDAAFSNDYKTSMDLVNYNLILFSLLSLSLSIGFAYYRLKKVKSCKSLIHFFIAISIILLTHVWVNAFKRPIMNRIPYVLFYSTEQYFAEKQIAREVRKQIDNGAICKTDSLIMVVVLGESLRSDHLGLNSYKRNTTPNLQERNVLSLPNIYSEYTYTNRSLPHILTRADSLHPNIAFTETSFISIFNHCNFQTTWLANQESADTYVYFMKECQNLVYANIGKNSYNYDLWTDGELLPSFDQTLKTANPRKLIILHTIGSHWWYNSHYPESFRKYNPAVKSRVLSSCSNEEMINSYDNTIYYTDYFLSQVIDRIKDKNSILLYLSDHGESLGERGMWLHASEAEALHHPAAFVWMSQKYKTANNDKYSALQKNLTKRYRSDFMFHSVLDAANIQSIYFQRGLSIFKIRENERSN